MINLVFFGYCTKCEFKCKIEISEEKLCIKTDMFQNSVFIHVILEYYSNISKHTIYKFFLHL